MSETSRTHTLGLNIRGLRQGQRLSQDQLSELTGIKSSHISTLEKGEGNPTITTIYKLLDALKCTPNRLLLEEGPFGPREAYLALIFDRLTDLPDREQESLLEVIDRYCIACETANLVNQTERRFYGGEE
jgi:transcriptional regulator with XRE-family HTH domain